MGSPQSLFLYLLFTHQEAEGRRDWLHVNESSSEIKTDDLNFFAAFLLF